MRIRKPRAFKEPMNQFAARDMIRVVLESPFAGKDKAGEEENLRYLRACLHDSIVNHRESPYASHGFLTQPGVLDDGNPDERNLGIAAGFLFREVCAKSVFYLDKGWSKGMQLGFEDACLKNRLIEYRSFLRGENEGSYTVVVGDHLSDRISMNAPGLPGGFVVRESREACIQALKEIAAEAK